MVVPKDVAEGWRPAESTPQVVGGGSPGAPREQNEVRADRIKENSTHRPAERERQPHEQTHCELAAALGTLDPLRTLAVYAAVGVASQFISPASTVFPLTVQVNLIRLPPEREKSIRT